MKWDLDQVIQHNIIIGEGKYIKYVINGNNIL